MKFWFSDDRHFESVSRRIFFFIIIANVLRFLVLDKAPPGFYVDEASGATHVLCLKQTGADFWGNAHPLFIRDLGAGYSTPFYIYGQTLWTSIFGNSVASFRAMVAFATLLTIFALAYLVKRFFNLHAALWVAFFASISPWGFQFSRIAWDPPLAPLFLIAGLAVWLTQKKSQITAIIASALFSFAAYSYPPVRIGILCFLILLPKTTLKEKLKIGVLFLLWSLPLLLYSWMHPEFNDRSRMLVLWSDLAMNPYHLEDAAGLIAAFFSQFFSHFSTDFLITSGDHNIRHSIQTFGMLDLGEVFALLAGIIALIWQVIRHQKKVFRFFDSQAWVLLGLALVGIISGIAPAALTWEGNPHALRAICAWPFFALASGIIVARFSQKKLWVNYAFFIVSAICAMMYFNSYFRDYPALAENWFKAEDSALANAYAKMADQGMSCESLRGK